MADESKDLTELEAAAEGTPEADSAPEESSAAGVPVEPGSSAADKQTEQSEQAQQPESDVEEAAAEPAAAEESAEEEPAEEDSEEAVVEEPAEEEEEEEQEAMLESPVPMAEEQTEDLASQMDWYILKVQSNRENSIVDALNRRVKIAGLESYFGEVIVPVEKVTEFKGGKKKVVKKKLYPGYIVAQMVVNEDTWFLVRETPGVGDFTGAGGKPTPMSPQDVERIRPKVEEGPTDEPRLKIEFKIGDKVKINDGTFENFEGEVSGIDEASGRVTVMINIFGRSTPVELEYWQVEKL